MQPCKTGDQPYSDASPNGECSLVVVNNNLKQPASSNINRFDFSERF